MTKTVRMGEYNGDLCFFQKICDGEDKTTGFLIFINLCNDFIVLRADGSVLETGGIMKKSCCLRCDAHEFDYDKKKEEWHSLRCIKGSPPNENSPNMQIDIMFGEAFQFESPEVVERDICPRCYEIIKETGEKLMSEKSTEITASLI